MIFIDDREPPRIAEKLKSMGIYVVEKRLEVGDYLVAFRGIEVPVERKDVNDYLNSIIDGRLFDQCHRMSSRYELSFLCIVGDVDAALEEREFRREAFIGSIVSVALRRNFGTVIPLILKTEDEFCSMLKSLNKQVEEGQIRTVPRVIRKRDLDDNIAMLAAIPGIGEEKARRLLEKFGSIHRIVNATIPELMRVEGIGEKQAKRIYEFVRGRKVR